jgi:hypothetical protein
MVKGFTKNGKFRPTGKKADFDPNSGYNVRMVNGKFVAESLDGYDYAEKPYWQKVSERTPIHKNFDPIWGSPIDEDGNVHDRENDDDLHEYGKPESSEGDSLKCSHCGQIFNPDNEQVLYSHLAEHGIT